MIHQKLTINKTTISPITKILVIYPRG